MLWLGLGIGIGGILGYGQYISWIQGFFQISISNQISISPATGYLWLLICGISWGGFGGVFLGWALSCKKRIEKNLDAKELSYQFFLDWRVGSLH